MRDPYQVLGVPSTATDEEVKKAYRDLARKYHPDNYHDNPLADLAQERMKEINEAYEAVQSQRKAQRSGGYSASGAGYGTGYGGYQSAYQGPYQGSSRYQRVRMAISSGDLNLAEELLNAQTNHDAEWNFLKGAICYRRGWLDEAPGQRGVPAGAGYSGGPWCGLPARWLWQCDHRHLRKQRLSAPVRRHAVLQRAGRARLLLLNLYTTGEGFPVLLK